MALQSQLTEQVPVSLLPRHAVEARVGIKTTKLYELMNEGRFPRPIKIDSRCLWPSNVIDSWIAGQIAAQQQAA